MNGVGGQVRRHRRGAARARHRTNGAPPRGASVLSPIRRPADGSATDAGAGRPAGDPQSGI